MYVTIRLGDPHPSPIETARGLARSVALERNRTQQTAADVRLWILRDAQRLSRGISAERRAALGEQAERVLTFCFREPRPVVCGAHTYVPIWLDT